MWLRYFSREMFWFGIFWNGTVKSRTYINTVSHNVRSWNRCRARLQWGTPAGISSGLWSRVSQQNLEWCGECHFREGICSSHSFVRWFSVFVMCIFVNVTFCFDNRCCVCFPLGNPRVPSSLTKRPLSKGRVWCENLSLFIATQRNKGVTPMLQRVNHARTLHIGAASAGAGGPSARTLSGKNFTYG